MAMTCLVKSLKSVGTFASFMTYLQVSCIDHKIFKRFINAGFKYLCIYIYILHCVWKASPAQFEAAVDEGFGIDTRAHPLRIYIASFYFCSCVALFRFCDRRHDARMSEDIHISPVCMSHRERKEQAHAVDKING